MTGVAAAVDTDGGTPALGLLVGDAVPEAAAAIETGVGLVLAAFGARGSLLAAPDPSGFELAAKADGLLLRMRSEAAAGLLDRSKASAVRDLLDPRLRGRLGRYGAGKGQLTTEPNDLHGGETRSDPRAF